MMIGKTTIHVRRIAFVGSCQARIYVKKKYEYAVHHFSNCQWIDDDKEVNYLVTINGIVELCIR